MADSVTIGRVLHWCGAWQVLKSFFYRSGPEEETGGRRHWRIARGHSTARLAYKPLRSGWRQQL